MAANTREFANPLSPPVSKGGGFPFFHANVVKPCAYWLAPGRAPSSHSTDTKPQALFLVLFGQNKYFVRHINQKV